MNSNLRIAIELVAAISIVVSLVFVGLELRQSSSIARLEAYQDFSISLSEFARDISHDPQFADLLSEAGTANSVTTIHAGRHCSC